MSELQIFNFKSSSVRVVTTELSEVLFVAKDIATALGYADTTKAIATHCKKSKSLINIEGAIHTVQQNQEVTNLDPKTKLIPESDVFRLIMRSNLEQAEEFQDWVCEDVLPSIRKTGSYSVPEFLKPITEPITLEDFNWRRDVVRQAIENLEKARVLMSITVSGKELLA